MARQIRLRRGTTAQNTSFTGAQGEVTMDTDLNTLRVHDGATPGGIIMAKRSDIPNSQQTSWYASPSARYVDITPGAHGAYYTAPSNGWFVMYIDSATQGFSIGWRNAENEMGCVFYIGSSGGRIIATLPVSSGQRAQAYHYNQTPSGIRFVYASGAY